MLTLQMIFRNEEGRNVTISVADARDDLQAPEVETVMTNLLNRQLFQSTGGDLEAPVRAQLVDRQVQVLKEF